jgi:predicted helicase
MTVVASPAHALNLKPTHKAVVTYYDALTRFEKLGVKHETAVRSAFQELLEHCARQFDWKLVPEYSIKRRAKADAKADGALLDNYGLNHGLWEAKDSADNLDKEIKVKFAAGYPKQNILFWQPGWAVLYQNGERFYQADLTKAENLIHILSLFLEFAPPAIAEWEKAVEEFRDRVPQIGASLKILIEKERQTNQQFITAFEGFYSLCRSSLNPNISVEAVEEMIIQHILTERIFRKIFAVADFIQRNVIAHEIDTVITALNSRSFSRDDFSKSLEHFYGAIENAASTITDFHEKQTFLNTVYERFFQGFCVKVADTHGVVYTPQPLVNFMVATVEHILKTAFKTSLSAKNVHILDPFTGTGNYIVNIMRRIPKVALPHKFAQELHCNEIMLLPYYVASMNIEHAYYEATDKYVPFEGICLVDTFQTVEKQQTELSFFNETNSARVERQKKTPIRVVIANPPYNAGQINENDNNKNRKYPEIDHRVSSTYGKASKATLLRKLSDPYVKAIRYATDRIGESGVVCFVNNNSFVTERTFDGMRTALTKDFDLIYVLDLGGNVRKNPKLSGTTHNVFGIQVGVSINLFVRLAKDKTKERQAKLYYYAVGADWRKEQKYRFLEKTGSMVGVKWKKLTPDEKSNWITYDTDEEFDTFLPVGSREAKVNGATDLAIFRTYSLGVSTNRDSVVYGFDTERLSKRVEQFVEDYNAELHRWQKNGRPKDLDAFLQTDKVKWSRDLKLKLAAGVEITFDARAIRDVVYRPFSKLKLYAEHPVIDRPGKFSESFPSEKSCAENRMICISDVGLRSPFSCLMTDHMADLHLCASTDGFQCFPLYTYAKDTKERRDNVTPKSLALFQSFYDDDAITREQIFHYIYALLHHSVYRTRYAENLKRDLPRIPLVGVVANAKGGALVSFFALSNIEAKQGGAKARHDPDVSATLFHAFADAGRKLADLHVNYDSAELFPLTQQETEGVKLDWRVDAMKLSKDRQRLFYNDFLTLSGIPLETYQYRLGNRSALEWVVDQYRVTHDENAKIVSDPNRLDDEQYIVRLIEQVITVSVETVKILRTLPSIETAADSPSRTVPINQP